MQAADVEPAARFMTVWGDTRPRVSGEDRRHLIEAVAAEALQHLTGLGFGPAAAPERMIKGADIRWRPASMWGVFSLGLG